MHSVCLSSSKLIGNKICMHSEWIALSLYIICQTDTEYLEKFNGFVMKEERLGISIRPFQMPPHYNGSSLPQYIDWKKKGVVTKVKKQVHTCDMCLSMDVICPYLYIHV